jgi:hypothetical protein
MMHISCCTYTWAKKYLGAKPLVESMGEDMGVILNRDKCERSSVSRYNQLASLYAVHATRSTKKAEMLS